VPPKFNNNTGSLEFEGGIPGGIIASKGVLTNITFRVKSVGEALIKFSDKSRIFLDDGKATDDLSYTGNGVYQFRLPPPAGPIVISETHPDQSVWYTSANAVLRFINEVGGVDGYSYVLNDDPVGMPDNISEGTRNSITYSSLAEGTHYFHVKSFRDAVWGGITHFALNVDTEPPAEFPINILPSARTTSSKPVIEWSTTDVSSGLDHYEIKTEPLTEGALASLPEGGKVFFIEATSPYVSNPLSLGSYNIIVRAFDKAGNYREVTKHLVITTPIFSIIQDKGIQIKNWVLIPWLWVWIILGMLLLVLGGTAYRVWFWHKDVHVAHVNNTLPQNISDQLEELKKYREKYGAKTAVIALLILLSSFVLHSNPVNAETLKITPPLISTFSDHITNKEIFYVGGHTAKSDADVVIYSQNLSTGETFSYDANADEEGQWFYRHSGFLPPGDYLLWAQTKEGDEFSAPSSQVKMTVERAAIQFGANRLSYETIYLFTTLLLLFIIIGLAIFISYHYRQGRAKFKKMQKNVEEAEESVRRGFAVLRRDIEGELEILRKGNMATEMAIEEKHREAELLNDLNFVQKRIGKEIWEIKRESW
jgi:hypothetical protein